VSTHFIWKVIPQFIINQMIKNMALHWSESIIYKILQENTTDQQSENWLSQVTWPFGTQSGRRWEELTNQVPFSLLHLSPQLWHVSKNQVTWIEGLVYGIRLECLSVINMHITLLAMRDTKSAAPYSSRVLNLDKGDLGHVHILPFIKK